MTSEHPQLIIGDPERVMLGVQSVGLRIARFEMRRVLPRQLNQYWCDYEMEIQCEVIDHNLAWSFVQYFRDEQLIGIQVQDEYFEGYTRLGDWTFGGPSRRTQVDLHIEVKRVADKVWPT